MPQERCQTCHPWQGRAFSTNFILGWHARATPLPRKQCSLSCLLKKAMPLWPSPPRFKPRLAGTAVLSPVYTKISTNKIIFQLAFSLDARCGLRQLAASRQRGPVIDTRPHSQRFAPLSGNNFLLGGTDVGQFRASHRSPLAPHLQRRTSTLLGMLWERSRTRMTLQLGRVDVKQD